MAGIDPVGVKLLHDRERTRRTTYDHLLQRLDPLARAFQMREEVEPYRGHPRRHGDAFLINQCRQGFTIPHFVTGHHQLGASNRTGVGISPGVDMKHGHDG